VSAFIICFRVAVGFSYVFFVFCSGQLKNGGHLNSQFWRRERLSHVADLGRAATLVLGILFDVRGES